MKGYFVYMFLDVEENPLYIGISINMITRIETQHFKSESGNLTEDCIYKTHKILYHQALSSDDMKIKERYLINTLNPEYNIKMNNKNRFSFTIDLEWKMYSLDIESLIEKRNLAKDKSKNVLINYTLEENKTLIFLEKLKERTYLQIYCGDFPESVDKNPFIQRGYQGGYQDVFIMRINNVYYFHCARSFIHWDEGEKHIEFEREYKILTHINNTIITKNRIQNKFVTIDEGLVGTETNYKSHTNYKDVDQYNLKYGDNAFIHVESNKFDEKLFRDIEWEDCGMTSNINYGTKKVLFIKVSILKELINENGKLLFNDSEIQYLNKVTSNINKYLSGEHWEAQIKNRQKTTEIFN